MCFFIIILFLYLNILLLACLTEFRLVKSLSLRKLKKTSNPIDGFLKYNHSEKITDCGMEKIRCFKKSAYSKT